MGAPIIFKLSDFMPGGLQTMRELPDGRWGPARPMGYQGLFLGLRLQTAWRVFIGRYDAIDWEDQGPSGHARTGPDATKRWYGSEEEIDRRVDQIVARVRDSANEKGGA